MWRNRRNQELDEELQAHIEIEIRRLMNEGMTRDQAEAAARRTLGSPALVAEVTRETWGAAWLGAL